MLISYLPNCFFLVSCSVSECFPFGLISRAHRLSVVCDCEIGEHLRCISVKVSIVKKTIFILHYDHPQPLGFLAIIKLCSVACGFSLTSCEISEALLCERLRYLDKEPLHWCRQSYLGFPPFVHPFRMSIDLWQTRGLEPFLIECAGLCELSAFVFQTSDS